MTDATQTTETASAQDAAVKRDATDAQVLSFIESFKSSKPEATYSEGLRAFRAEGYKCPAKRFEALWNGGVPQVTETATAATETTTEPAEQVGEAECRKAVAALQSDLNKRFPERRDVVEGAMAAILSGEHILLLGPPGTAKSALVKAIAQAFGGSYFERLMTRFSTPEELFGPVSLKGLKEDRFERVVTGKLPTANFAFIDEIFKSNSAILNSLLSMLNERIFHNDGKVIRCPLMSAFGASNEMPESKELDALFDRFLLRYEVQYLLKDSNFKSVMLAPEPTTQVQLDMETLKSAQAYVAQVKVTDATVESLLQIRNELSSNGIVVSDRRCKRSLKLAQALAWLNGESETAPEFLSILSDAFWRESKEKAKVTKVVALHTDPVTTKVNEVLEAARETANKLNAHRDTDRGAFIAQSAKALGDLNAQVDKLRELYAKSTKRAKTVIERAADEVKAMHTDITNAVRSQVMR